MNLNSTLPQGHEIWNSLTSKIRTMMVTCGRGTWAQMPPPWGPVASLQMVDLRMCVFRNLTQLRQLGLESGFV